MRHDDSLDESGARHPFDPRTSQPRQARETLAEFGALSVDPPRTAPPGVVDGANIFLVQAQATPETNQNAPTVADAAAAAAAERQNDPMAALLNNPMIEGMMSNPEMMQQMQSMVRPAEARHTFADLPPPI